MLGLFIESLYLNPTHVQMKALCKTLKVEHSIPFTKVHCKIPQLKNFNENTHCIYGILLILDATVAEVFTKK